MRALWKGSISFGLVNIPVRLYAATERKDIKFNYLHNECGTPVRYVKFCPTCNKEITQQDIVYGYEYEPGRFVVVKDEDLESIPVAQTKSVDIVDFVDLPEIDPIYFDKTYFLEPAEGGSKAYALLRGTMQQSGKIGIAKVTIRTRESLACVRVYHDNTLVMETMFYPDEIRSTAALAGTNEQHRIDDREIDMANLLVSSLSSHFEPAKYTNEYRMQLREMIRAKIEGREITEAPEPQMGKVVDLMEALRRSVEAVQSERGAPRAEKAPPERQHAAGPH